MNRNIFYAFFAAVLLVGISGCVRESSEGTTRVFSYELWVPLSVLIAGVAAAPAGWFLRQASARFGWGLLIMGPVLAVFFAPSLFRDRASLDDTSFSLRTGIWGLTSVHDVKFDDLAKVRIVSEEVTGRRGSKRTNYYMLCERKDGSSAKIPINNKVAETAATHFLEKISKLGIPIVNET